MDELLQEFLAESTEDLAQLDTEIVELEKKPGDSDLLASIFRTIHTIKGTSGFIGLNRLGSVAHSAENVLGRMRDGELQATPDAISVVLEAVDSIKDLLSVLESTGEEPDVDHSDLIRRLDELASYAAGGSGPAASEAGTSENAGGSEEPGADEAAPAAQSPQGEVAADATADAGSAPAANAKGAESAASGAAADGETDPAADDGQSQDGGKKSVANLSIRVNVDVLDTLMNLAGELVLTRNQLLQMARGDEESRYAAPINHLNRVTTDLQEGVMKTRMQPIGNAWGKLPRLVRDLAQTTGKQIELEMSGSETELDRTVLDAIKDPLTHMVRNSADHGIETPDVRRNAGKPEVGTIKLNAYHEGGHVIICIEDDGAGIDLDKVRNRAVQNGLVSENDAARLTDNEVLQLVFQPGFSTAEKISSVSGRGVGMDVVRTEIEKIGGTVDMTSTPGSGSTVKIKIPLTLAIISALVVESGGESFAIPQLGVVELVRLAAEDKHRIETIRDKEVLRLRDRLLPLVHLNDILGLEEPESEDDANEGGERDTNRDTNIVVVQVGEEQFGLIVSEVFDTEEIVVKPVGSLLKDIDIYQGTTILGDGRVIMILDVTGIASQFGGVSSGAFGGVSSAATEQHRHDEDGEQAGEMTSLLLFEVGNGTTMSVPLSLVARLEEIPREQLEQTGDKMVVQYRGDLLPLLPAEGVTVDSDGPDPQPVIVFSDGRSSMGLMVDRIEDVIQEQLTIRMQSQRPGLLGTAIINGRTTDVIDTHHYIMKANPGWFARNDKDFNQRMLVVDDSLFFRQLATTALEAEGYRVFTADSAVQAVDLIERGERFDLILSDLDMPNMDGCEFAQWVRSRPDTQETPMIAVTSFSGPTHESRATDAGFDRFLVKFDATRLVSMIEELCVKQQNTGASA